MIPEETKKGERLSAFEISVTNPVQKEVQHIRNCFRAGIHEVVMVCLEPAKLSAIREAAMGALPNDTERISFCLPAELSEKLMALAAKSKSTDTVIHGRRTKVEYQSLSPEETERRRQALAQVAAGSIKKIKGKK